MDNPDTHDIDGARAAIEALAKGARARDARLKPIGKPLTFVCAEGLHQLPWAAGSRR
jgi:hypothetical protein